MCSSEAHAGSFVQRGRTCALRSAAAGTAQPGKRQAGSGKGRQGGTKKTPKQTKAPFLGVCPVWNELAATRGRTDG